MNSNYFDFHADLTVHGSLEQTNTTLVKLQLTRIDCCMQNPIGWRSKNNFQKSS